ncbi:MAG: oligosaccharide flippase family protein [Candidatus Omnitrophica bacterium]|nr:oligosaccharide flippase family protein [Candidatus Omnitrophota bacterium]
MSLSDRVIKNVFFSWAYYLISLLCGIFLMPFMVHRLGDTVYGIWILILSLAGYMGLFDLGIRSSIVKYVAELHANNKQNKLNELINTSLFTYGFIGFLILGITIIVSIYFSRFFQINASFINESRLVLLLVGLNVAISLPLAVFGSIIWGLQRHDIFSAIEILVLIIRTVLIIIFILLGFKLVALAIITLVTNIFGNCLRIYYAFRINPGLRINHKLFNRITLKLIFNYAFFVFLIGISTRIISYTDSIVIGIFMSVAMITYYSIALKLIDYSRDIISVMTSVLVPTTSELDAKKEFAKVQRLLILGTKYSFMLTLPIAFSFILLGKPLIGLWMGQKYASSATILMILVIPQLLSISQYMSSVILQGIGKLKTFTTFILLEALANLILSLILIKHYGLIGVALGTAIPFIINKAIILPVYICKVVGQNLIEYIKKTTILPLIASIPYVILILLFKKTFYPKSILILIAEISICFLIYCAISINLCLEKLERQALWQSVKKLFPRSITIEQNQDFNKTISSYEDRKE